MNKTIAIAVITAIAVSTAAAGMPTTASYTNSIGMEFVRIEPGQFQMGQINTPLPPQLLPVFRGRGLFDIFAEGDFDEHPVHRVRITRPFYIGVCEVTNKQYELFRPEHKDLRGKDGISKNDDEAVCFVSWYDAAAFCDWLSDQEGLPCRLATEAEWEYACRAGTETNFSTGDMAPEEHLDKVYATKGGQNQPHDLTVGRNRPNAWGVYDMHGNLEEWTGDWYGPYPKGEQEDPVGHADGEFRVTRGGSYGTDIYYLRSANRMGAIPESRNRITGFRVIIGPKPDTKPLTQPLPRHQRNVANREPALVAKGPDPDVPYFQGPLRYVNIPRGSEGPVWSCHNHDPGIAECPNGDLLSVWYTCADEGGSELGQAASRLRYGSDHWEQADLFFYTPDRNNHAPALWHDKKTGRLFHFTSVGRSRGRIQSALVMRTSSDSGATWSGPRFVNGEFEKDNRPGNKGQTPSGSVFRMNDGTICFAIDGSDTLWMSKNDGLSWFNPGGDIPGIHAGVTQLSDGTIFAMPRGGNINDKLSIYKSHDGGKTFDGGTPTEFASVHGGQRLSLLRLREGYIFLASFTSERGPGMMITDGSGNRREIRGFFAALSMDNGKTWPYRRLISHDGPATTAECTDGAAIAVSARNAEYRGYSAACQGLNGLIHVITSRNHYAFNLAWLMTAPPPPVDEPMHVAAAVETFGGLDFDLDDWHDYKGPRLTARDGIVTLDSPCHFNGINRRVGTGSFEAQFHISNIRFNEQGPRPSEGLAVGFRDSMSADSKTMFVYVKTNEISSRFGEAVAVERTPESIKVRFVYNDNTRCWRIYYGLNGAESASEFVGAGEICWPEPASESNAAYIMMSNGSVDLDRFEIRPLS